MSSLDLGVVGNCNYAALIDRMGRVVWCCLPRLDGDPVFCSLIDGASEDGQFAIEIVDFARGEQVYLRNTAVLVTRLYDSWGGGIEIVDFAPRFSRAGRRFRPATLARMVRPIDGLPKVRIRLRPRFSYGAARPQVTAGSNHIRYVHDTMSVRLTTDLPVGYVLEERQFLLRGPAHLIFGPDESLGAPILDTVRDWYELTVAYWQDWVRSLNIPFEWQDAVIRSAIALKLCSYESTGAIVAALTTSIPEAAGTGRTWDYRYCWPRDAYFTLQALNRIAAHQTMEDYLLYLEDVVANAPDGHIQPVYGITLEDRLEERMVPQLAGYRGDGPIRRGNQAFEHRQHDVYGEIVLAATQAFFDQRLLRPADESTFRRLEQVGEQAFRLHAAPDAGIWEFRTREQVHTLSSVMCWVACDRLAKIATHLGLLLQADGWRRKARRIRALILERGWNEQAGSFVSAFGTETIDASLLLLAEVGFVAPRDPRFLGTVRAIETRLRRGSHLLRYADPDDFGTPDNAFIICTFWYIDALARVGRAAEARELFETMLAQRNHVGLLSEDLDPRSGELWGNFPQTYSHVGLINSAMRLSRNWEQALGPDGAPASPRRRVPEPA